MKKRSFITIQVILLASVLYLILLAGLSSNGYSMQNKVFWLPDQAGIKFEKYGIAYTSPFISAEQAKVMNTSGFSMEIALHFATPYINKFKFVALIHNGVDHDQLLLAQWRNYLIIMNNDDYKHKRNTSRIVIPIPEAASFFLTVTTKHGWSKLYLDGKRVKIEKNVALNLPVGAGNGRLIFGNSIHGRHPWSGVIHGFAMYNGVINDDLVQQHYLQWLNLGDFSFAKAADPFLLYLFNEKSGYSVSDYSRHNAHLEIPLILALVEKESFVLPFSHLGSWQICYQDMVINLIGFLPFGFILAMIIHGGREMSMRTVALLVVAAGFMVSFGIELLQSWMPSRNSSLLDLILNTTGSYLGALGFVYFSKHENFFTLRH
jgi:VanZ family protein